MFRRFPFLRFVVASLLWVAGPAWADDTLWLAKDADSTRFLGESVPGPKFSAGTRVTVLLREGEQARVFVGDRYGWVPSAALTDQAPKSEGGMPSGAQEIKLTPDGSGNLIPMVPPPALPKPKP